MNTAAGEVPPPSRVLTGPASPRRLVCAPGAAPTANSVRPATLDEHAFDLASTSALRPAGSGNEFSEVVIAAAMPIAPQSHGQTDPADHLTDGLDPLVGALDEAIAAELALSL